MWTFTSDVEEYAAVAEPFLLGDPVRHTVALTVLADLRAGLPVKHPLFGWWTSGGEIRGAVFRTPPHPAGLFAVPVEAVAPLLAALEGGVSQVVGPVEVISEVVRLLGEPSRAVSERLYRLVDLTVPDVPGRGRLAVPGDFPLLVSWYHAFGAEVGMGEADVAERVARRLSGRELFVWEDEGAPVSLAALSPACGGVCRIGPVYTPPSRRRRGYGAAVTAYASRIGLDERCDQVVLFTDLANPTSNSVYRSIGYRPISDYAHLTYAE
ncbi:GNAT family N-acetyltransferase [Nonomuraea aridisoli]|uniref:GNAT family N-acetyltransferase n=1 Tax=Nonomuraea aridisoli TaxID=2070368 RepID=A0A2W2FXV2_9ACTN|nr:GNAT family N-acetyltransferase [Nonomuraea aridisoli]PZG19614.1 GNAT family N-acetyltransferase [Nonomuraea aridisoli]